MKKEDLINYWIVSSESDYTAMKSLINSKDFAWALFIGHLVIEKLIKALAVKNNILLIPKIHNLNKLMEFSGLQTDEQTKDLLDIITTFNIETRYPDYKREFFQKCDFEFANKYKTEIENLRLWLLGQLKK